MEDEHWILPMAYVKLWGRMDHGMAEEVREDYGQGQIKQGTLVYVRDFYLFFFKFIYLFWEKETEADIEGNRIPRRLSTDRYP